MATKTDGRRSNGVAAIAKFSTSIDIPADARDKINTILNQQLADTADLFTQLKHAHWNVRGKDFYQLHLLFDQLAACPLEWSDEIAERIGAGQPPGMVFKGRVSTGHHFRELSEAVDSGNLITSRILWLRGLEPGVNRGGEVDTYDRYVYIHGTNREADLGRPQSAGCVIMSNLDVIELYDQVPVGAPVYIA